MPKEHDSIKNAGSHRGTAVHNGKKMHEAQPLVSQRGEVIQDFGTAIRLPIALSEEVCSESIRLLNQILADTITIRDLYKKHHWQVAGIRSINCICFSTNITRSRTSWWTRLPKEFNCWAGSAWRWRTTWLR